MRTIHIIPPRCHLQKRVAENVGFFSRLHARAFCTWPCVRMCVRACVLAYDVFSVDAISCKSHGATRGVQALARRARTLARALARAWVGGAGSRAWRLCALQNSRALDFCFSS